tara:strand:+ start:507 stop:704 length:198 start_codon:yes stop_codon:yes gene_type:complete
MTHHLIDTNSEQLQIILDRLILEEITYSIEISQNGLVTMIKTDDDELLEYCTTNNPDLIQAESNK